ncbi:hypothetical protein [Actinoplanes sp. HUAS TT8]|uniref:hypothetical protein n=1 Tax=Actinoplanes sp. HUAS TT8 TaxID=3447453 RepID=UPI003F520CC6
MTYPDPTAGPNYSAPNYSPPAYEPPAYEPQAYQPPAQNPPPAPRQPVPPQAAPPPAPGQYGPPAAPGQYSPQVPPPAMPYQAWASADAKDDYAQRQINLAEDAARGKKDITVGAIWFVVGGLITVVTMASDASVYIVAWGPMLYGAYRVIKGILAVRRAG